MKKIIGWLFFVLVVLLLIAGVAIHFFLDGEVKKQVETLGPELTKASVKLDTVNISLFSGSGKIKGFVLGNPEGYKSPSALSVGTGSLVLRPASLLSDKIVIHSISLDAPQVTLETDLMQNNLGKLLSNLEEATGGGKEPTQSKEPSARKKLQVDDFLMSGGKIRVIVNAFGGKTASVTLPEIRLKDLGKNPEGITAAELSRLVLQTLVARATEAAAGAIADLGKGALFFSNEPGKTSTNSVEKATRGLGEGLGDLLKKKP